MSCRILEDSEQVIACFYDSVTETAFGPLMADSEEAEAFMDYLEAHPTQHNGRTTDDPRAYVDSLLRHHFDEFKRQPPSVGNPADNPVSRGLSQASALTPVQMADFPYRR